MKKNKLTNTWKHAAVGIVAGLLFHATVWLLLKIDPTAQLNLGWVAVIAFSFGAITFEARQNSKNWIDTAVDLIAGIGCFMLVLWAGGAI